jgi:hypothetical protein
LSALAKLAARRDDLRKEQDALAADAVAANQFYEIVTLNTLHGKQYSSEERKEIDALMKQRGHLLARMAKIEADLAVIQKDGVAIKKHCSATPVKFKMPSRRSNKNDTMPRPWPWGWNTVCARTSKRRRLRFDDCNPSGRSLIPKLPELLPKPWVHELWTTRNQCPAHGLERHGTELLHESDSRLHRTGARYRNGNASG